MRDPLNDTSYRHEKIDAIAILSEAPDRLGTLPFSTAIETSSREGEIAATIASIIDHTLLKPDALPEEIDNLCEEAKQYSFFSVCVNPIFVRRAVDNLAGSGVVTCAVVGFPLGATLSDVKAMEARRAIEEGAGEIDMVLPIGLLRSGAIDAVKQDISEVVRACPGTVGVKVIMETCLLDDAQKVAACRAAQEAGASFVKTSTGFSSGGATVEDIRLMRREVGSRLGVKASGGIRDFETAQKMVCSGASRLGTSASVAIASGVETSGNES
ncbi:MAG TPA: deoxyribose-phosphate aldolase [Planctomycetes bacterium]|nr:deoxyribose-phosphate aldolase [Planctomycetota bacterium]HIN81054.1 deoxyribose-phosphate aldolase [Planctomycetota bacterium]